MQADESILEHHGAFRTEGVGREWREVREEKLSAACPNTRCGEVADVTSGGNASLQLSVAHA